MDCWNHSIPRLISPLVDDAMEMNIGELTSFAPALGRGDEASAPGSAPIQIMIPKPLKIGVGGPVGSGKTALVGALCRRMHGAAPARDHRPRHLARARTRNFP